MREVRDAIAAILDQTTLADVIAKIEAASAGQREAGLKFDI
jgi:DNA-binding IscR family transcriptional regulator